MIIFPEAKNDGTDLFVLRRGLCSEYLEDGFT